MATILVVEDDKDTAEGLRAYLVKFGHKVNPAANGGAALASVFADPPDVIVLDLLLPGMDGAAVLEVIRSYYRLQALPVVVWTGAGPGHVLDRARFHRPSAILIKPRDNFPEVLAAINRATHPPH